jgi:hypothetical protein
MALEKACGELQAKMDQVIQPSVLAMSHRTKRRRENGTARIPSAGKSGMR